MPNAMHANYSALFVTSKLLVSDGSGLLLGPQSAPQIWQLSTAGCWFCVSKANRWHDRCCSTGCMGHCSSTFTAALDSCVVI
jgi:hypothetical protein